MACQKISSEELGFTLRAVGRDDMFSLSWVQTNHSCGGLFVSWVRQSFAVMLAGNTWTSCILRIKRSAAEVSGEEGTSLPHPGYGPSNLEGHAQFSENWRDEPQFRK